VAALLSSEGSSCVHVDDCVDQVCAVELVHLEVHGLAGAIDERADPGEAGVAASQQRDNVAADPDGVRRAQRRVGRRFG
jgi:hypothetical protein